MGPPTPKSKSDRSGGSGRGRGGDRTPKMCVPLNITPIKVNVDSPQHPFERLPPGEEGREGKTGVGRGRGGGEGWGEVGRAKNWKKIEQNDPKKTQKMGQNGKKGPYDSR
jgi:hypothetical protein